MVAEFHDALGGLTLDTPAMPDFPTRSLRLALIREELAELEEAIDAEDIVQIADALGDLLYVVYGAALAFGVDLEPVFAEIHRSNMTKRGGPVREDGKVLKPTTYSPPDLAPILAAQSRLA